MENKPDDGGSARGLSGQRSHPRLEAELLPYIDLREKWESFFFL